MLTAACYTELKESRIPNWITIPGLLVGLLAGYLPGGLPFGSAIMGFLAAFFFLFIFYMFGGMGGGDVKLMAAVGALQGYPVVMTTLVYTAFIGGAMAIWVLICNRNFWHGIVQSTAMLFRLRKPAEEQTEEAEAKMGTVPYGIAIIAGALLTTYFTL
jgi:prepilin peptidase CpaA